MAPKCQELICAFVMWTDGAGERRGWEPPGEERPTEFPSRCGVLWGRRESTGGGGGGGHTAGGHAYLSREL